jgi:catechol 2,3-dioxygenase-like lactoylglutathione lyase family enzyme
MEPRIHLITLAVSDLKRALAFYRDGLGLESKGIIGAEFTGSETAAAGAVTTSDLYGGLILALYPRTELAKDGRSPSAQPKLASSASVMPLPVRLSWMRCSPQAAAAGATLTDGPHDRPWGIYSGYCRDLDGHLWEVSWNPDLEDI